jgi:hypothetical protein
MSSTRRSTRQPTDPRHMPPNFYYTQEEYPLSSTRSLSFVSWDGTEATPPLKRRRQRVLHQVQLRLARLLCDTPPIFRSIHIPDDMIALHLNGKYLFGMTPDDASATYVASNL